MRFRRTIARLVFTSALLIGAWLLWRVVASNWAAVADLSSRGPEWCFVGYAVACYLIAQVLPMFRWRMLARAAGVPVSAWAAFGIGVAGETGNLVMPGANGGDAIKIGLIVQSGLPITRLIASSIADRISGLAGLLCVGFAAGLLQWRSASPILRSVTLLVGFLLAVILIGVVFATRPWFLGTVLSWCPRWPRALQCIDQLQAVASAYRSRRGILGAAVTLSMVSQLFALGSLYCAGRAASQSAAPSLASTLVGGPLVFISTALPLPFGAIGFAEEVGEQLFAALGFAGGGLAMLGYRISHTFAVAVLVVSYWCARLFMNGRKTLNAKGKLS